jgi:hypothetical protein
MSEKTLHAGICNYIKLRYPNVLFNSDLSGIKLTIGQAVQVKKLRSNQGFPDIVIYEARHGYQALFIELKAEGVKIRIRDGGFASPHIAEQEYVLSELRDRGYKAEFAVGFDETKSLIDSYLK